MHSLDDSFDSLTCQNAFLISTNVNIDFPDSRAWTTDMVGMMCRSRFLARLGGLGSNHIMSPFFFLEIAKL